MAYAISRHLQAVFEKGNAPTDEYDFPKGNIFELEMAVPGDGHKNIGKDEQYDGAHGEWNLGAKLSIEIQVQTEIKPEKNKGL